MKSISVIIPTFNGKNLLERYLPSIIKALNTSSLVSRFEIIVIDDSSEDDTLTFLKDRYPEVIAISNETNLGFSKTINRGIEIATCELAFLLNNDIQLPENHLDKLIPFFDDFNVFGVFSAIKDEKGINIIEGQKLPRLKKTSLHYSDNLSQSKPSNSLYLCGGNALVDLKKLTLLNGFETIYSPFYFEDFDLSIRAWKQGWKCIYTPETFCLHCHSATINSNYSKEDIELTFVRNKLFFNYLNLDSLSFSLFNLSLRVKYVFSIFSSSKSKRIFKKACQQFFQAKSELKHKRLRNEKLKKNSLAKVLEFYL